MVSHPLSPRRPAADEWVGTERLQRVGHGQGPVPGQVLILVDSAGALGAIPAELLWPHRSTVDMGIFCAVKLWRRQAQTSDLLMVRLGLTGSQPEKDVEIFISVLVDIPYRGMVGGGGGSNSLGVRTGGISYEIDRGRTWQS